MNVGPDGSLCRITSSFKDVINNIMIVKDPNSDPVYNLVWLKCPDEPEEKLEISDDELSDELTEIEFPCKNIEKEVVDKPIDKIDKQNETFSEKYKKKHNHHNRHRPYNKNRYYNRGNNNFNKIRNTYKGLSNMEGVYNYGNRDFNSLMNDEREFNSLTNRERDFNSTTNRDFNASTSREFSTKANRNFNSKPNHHAPYSTDSYKHFDKFTVSPWIEPPMPSMLSNPIFPLPGSSFGLLGDRPSRPSYDQVSSYSPIPVASNSLNNSFVHNQNSSYSPITPNYSSGKQADKFNHDKKYWNDGYHNYGKNNQPRNKYNTNKQNKNSWNNNHERHRNARNSSSFNYRK